MITFWHNHSLSLVLLVVMIVQTIYAIWSGHYVWLGHQETHSQPLDYRDFWLWWTYEYHVSLVADTYGAILLVVLTKRLREKDSAESD